MIVEVNKGASFAALTLVAALTIASIGLAIATGKLSNLRREILDNEPVKLEGHVYKCEQVAL